MVDDLELFVGEAVVGEKAFTVAGNGETSASLCRERFPMVKPGWTGVRRLDAAPEASLEAILGCTGLRNCWCLDSVTEGGLRDRVLLILGDPDDAMGVAPGMVVVGSEGRVMGRGTEEPSGLREGLFSDDAFRTASGLRGVANGEASFGAAAGWMSADPFPATLSCESCPVAVSSNCETSDSCEVAGGEGRRTSESLAATTLGS